MQHGPSYFAMFTVFLLFAGIMWLGGRILPKWHSLYAGKRVRYSYWGITAATVAILIFSRWLRPAGGFPGEWFRYFIYAAYIWMVGLVLMLMVLLFGHAVRSIYKKVRKKNAVLEQEFVPGESSGMVMTRRRFLQGVVAAVPALPLAVSAYGVIGGDTRMVINRYTLAFPQLPLALDGYKIAQISDTHIGPFFGMNRLDKVLALVNKEQPQLLAITGDLVDDLDLLTPTIERLTAFQPLLPDGIFYCWGNHEYFRDINRIRKALSNSPIAVLENSNQTVGKGLYFAGVDYPWSKNKQEQEATRQQYFSQAFKDIPTGAFTVLLTHHPDFFNNAFAAGVPLSLAGHTHGGQVEIFGRSLLPVEYKYMRGMFREGGSYGYVSVGTGHWLPLRIGCPAEISIFTLKAGQLGQTTARREGVII